MDNSREGPRSWQTTELVCRPALPILLQQIVRTVFITRLFFCNSSVKLLALAVTFLPLLTPPISYAIGSFFRFRICVTSLFTMLAYHRRPLYGVFLFISLSPDS